jgi:hypothetical protein
LIHKGKCTLTLPPGVHFSLLITRASGGRPGT